MQAGRVAIASVTVVVPLTIGVLTAYPSLSTDAQNGPVVHLRAVLRPAGVVPAPRHVRRGVAGEFAGTLVAGRLTWRLRLKRLTSLAYGAHVHFGPPGTKEIRFGEDALLGQQEIFLCGPCVSGSHGVEPPLRRSMIRTLLGGRAFVVVHTGLNQFGEIGGRLKLAQK